MHQFIRHFSHLLPKKIIFNRLPYISVRIKGGFWTRFDERNPYLFLSVLTCPFRGYRCYFQQCENFNWQVEVNLSYDSKSSFQVRRIRSYPGKSTMPLLLYHSIKTSVIGGLLIPILRIEISAKNFDHVKVNEGLVQSSHEFFFLFFELFIYNLCFF